MANTSLPNLTERTATANSDLIHVNSGGTDYKETKGNFLSDVNSSISALNNSLATKQDNLKISLVYSGSIEKSSSYSLSASSGTLYLVIFGTWNFKGVYLVNPQNGGSPQVATLLNTIACSFSANGAWGFTVNNVNSSYAMPVSIFKFL